MKQPPPTQPMAPDRGQWRHRLGYYLLGVAIGLVLLGMVTFGKRLLAPRPLAPTPTGAVQAGTQGQPATGAVPATPAPRP